MKGIDVTPEQMEAARQFLALTRSDPNKGMVPPDDQQLAMQFGAVARVVAWYGAIRYVAGRDGNAGTLEAPAPIEVIQP